MSHPFLSGLVAFASIAMVKAASVRAADDATPEVKAAVAKFHDAGARHAICRGIDKRNGPAANYGRHGRSACCKWRN